MGFDIQIKCAKRLVIPKEAGYVPPNPETRGSIRLSGQQMALINSVMAAVGILDERIRFPWTEERCADRKIPGYKFNFNDGEHITRDEAAGISDALTREDLLSEKFLRARFKRLRDPVSEESKAMARRLLSLWIAFNKVAAANDGYTIH